MAGPSPQPPPEARGSCATVSRQGHLNRDHRSRISTNPAKGPAGQVEGVDYLPMNKVHLKAGGVSTEGPIAARDEAAAHLPTGDIHGHSDKI